MVETLSPRPCRDAAQETLRTAARRAIDGTLADLHGGLHWLASNDISVLTIEMRRGWKLPRVTVAPSPWLHVMFGQECANIGRRMFGTTTYYKWIGVRHGCAITWEEVAP